MKSGLQVAEEASDFYQFINSTVYKQDFKLKEPLVIMVTSSKENQSFVAVCKKRGHLLL
jgi:hypothetical protein